MTARRPETAAARSSRLGSAVIGLLAASALLPVAGLGIRLIASGLPQFPVDGDHALIEIATRQAAAGGRLLGPYSRFGFHHPGPALFYLFAPFFAASGGSYLAVCLAVVVLDLTSLAVVLGVLSRSMRSESLAWPSLVLAGYALFLEPSVLVSPWNPHAILLPLLATLVAAAAVMAGRYGWLPVSVAGASLVLQSHLGLLPVLAAAAVLVVLARVRRYKPAAAAPDNAAARVGWPAAAVIAVVAWFPVGLEAALHGGGNLAAIASFLIHRPSGQPLGASARTVLAHLGAPLLMPWGATARNVPGGQAVWLGLAMVLATAAALVVARLRRRTLGTALAGTELVAVGAAVFATMSIVGPLHEYLVRWVTVLAPLGLIAIGESLRPEASRASNRRVLSVALGLALAVAAVAGWRATLTWDDIERLQSSDGFTVNRSLGDAALAEAARPGTAGITITPVESDRWGLAAAVAARLLSARDDVAVGSRWRGMFGLLRLPRPEDLRLGVVATDTYVPGATLAAVEGSRLVRLEPQPLTTGELAFGSPAASAYLLDGFDAAEGSASEGYRWIVGRRGRILLPISEPSEAAIVAFELAPLAVAGTAQRVTVRVDGRLAGTTSLEPDAFAWYRFAMPYGTAPGIVVVELEAAWARSPFELERSLDVRPLSLRIRRLRLEPAASVTRAPQPLHGSGQPRSETPPHR